MITPPGPGICSILADAADPAHQVYLFEHQRIVHADAHGIESFVHGFKLLELILLVVKLLGVHVGTFPLAI